MHFIPTERIGQVILAQTEHFETPFLPNNGYSAIAVVKDGIARGRKTVCITRSYTLTTCKGHNILPSST